MKKVLFAIALVLTMCFSASAQSDGFFRSNDGFSDDRSAASSGTTPGLPHGHIGALKDDQPASVPVGSGLMIMTALGGAYLLRKRVEN